MYGLPRYLYHGTSTVAAEKILKEGIRPKFTDTWGNFPGVTIIHPDMEGKYYANPYVVYLGKTDYDACFYSERAMQTLHLEGYGVVFEVDTAKLVQTRFRADENCGYGSILTKKMRRLHRDRDWKASLNRNGLMSYNGLVPLSAIRAYREAAHDRKWTFIGDVVDRA